MCQPARVRDDGFSLFTGRDPNNVLSSRFIQSWIWARGVMGEKIFKLMPEHAYLESVSGHMVSKVIG